MISILPLKFILAFLLHHVSWCFLDDCPLAGVAVQNET
nr:MAG TPA: hypothetical protein [Caudoviricetes sp.]